MRSKSQRKKDAQGSISYQCRKPENSSVTLVGQKGPRKVFDKLSPLFSGFDSAKKGPGTCHNDGRIRGAGRLKSEPRK